MPDITLPINVLNNLQPGISFLRREAITGIFTGEGDLDRPALGVGVNAFGLSWDFFSVPAPFGRELGQPDVFDRRMLQLAAIHTSTDSHQFISEYHAFFVEGIYWQWANIFPSRIHYVIAPGVEVVFFWLLI